MYTPNASSDWRFEAIIYRGPWPEWLAELERTQYQNDKLVPGHFVDYTAGYASECAVLFPETVQVDAIEWLLVSIVNAAPTSTGLAITVAAGESIDILVQPRRGFTVVGEARATLDVPASGESLPLRAQSADGPSKARSARAGRGSSEAS